MFLDELVCEAKIADLERSIEAALARSALGTAPGTEKPLRRGRPAPRPWRWATRTARAEAGEP